MPTAPALYSIEKNNLLDLVAIDRAHDADTFARAYIALCVHALGGKRIKQSLQPLLLLSLCFHLITLFLGAS